MLVLYEPALRIEEWLCQRVNEADHMQSWNVMGGHTRWFIFHHTFDHCHFRQSPTQQNTIMHT